MAYTSVASRVGAGASVMDGVWDFFFDFLGEDFLQLLGDDAVTYSVGGVGSLRHCCEVVVVIDGCGWESWNRVLGWF